MSGFCASCVDGTEGLQPENHDGRTVQICRPCREDHPRAGRYAFAETSARSLRSGKWLGNNAKSSIAGRRRE